MNHIDYLGHIIDKVGWCSTAEKVRAIQDAHTSKDVTQLHSFLGILTYYHKFLPKLLSTFTSLMNMLGRISGSEAPSFHVAKETLQANLLLLYFDPNKPLILACDVSEYASEPYCLMSWRKGRNDSSLTHPGS